MRNVSITLVERKGCKYQELQMAGTTRWLMMGANVAAFIKRQSTCGLKRDCW